MITTSEEIINYMLSNCENHENTPLTVNEEKWTLADLFIRQYLNNMCDGFNLYNIEDVYCYLAQHKNELIANNLISSNAWNNCGYKLWENYKFDKFKQK